MSKSLNKVCLIGNLTRDVEKRLTPSGTAVASFGLATNRSWTTDKGEKHGETEFHSIVAWNKLADICEQFLKKGSKVYVEGRLAQGNGRGKMDRRSRGLRLSQMMSLSWTTKARQLQRRQQRHRQNRQTRTHRSNLSLRKWYTLPR